MDIFHLWSILAVSGEFDSRTHSQHGNRSTQVHRLNYMEESISYDEDAMVA